MSKKPCNITAADALNAYAAGLTLKQIAKKHMCSHSTVRHRLIDTGIYKPIHEPQNTFGRTAHAVLVYNEKYQRAASMYNTMQRKGGE